MRNADNSCNQVVLVVIFVLSESFLSFWPTPIPEQPWKAPSWIGLETGETSL